MHGGAKPVTLSVGSVGGRPVFVVRAERGDVPRALLQHLRDCAVVQIEAMLDGVASAVEGPMQANSAGSVAGNFFAPSVSFIDDGFQLFYGESRLRDELAVLSDPGAVGHVDLDPVG